MSKCILVASFDFPSENMLSVHIHYEVQAAKDDKENSAIYFS